MKLLQSILFSVLSLAILSCSSDQISGNNTSNSTPTSFSIEKPFETIEKAFEEFVYEGKEKTFELLGGTVIEFPEEAFAEEGKITVKVREFFTAGEILASGIPMKYDSAGITSDFQSAGMLEIRMLKDGKEVVLKENKEAKVIMTSSKKESNYNLYDLNEENGKWNFKCKQAVEAKPKDVARINAINEELKQFEKPAKPVKNLKDRKVFDLNYKMENHTELKELANLMWQYTGKDEKRDITNNPDFLKKNWKKVAIYPTDKELVYFLKLTDQDTTFRTTIRPVLRGELLTSANEEYSAKLKVYNNEIKDRIIEKKRLEREDQFLRSFALKGGGIYNYDRQFKVGNTVQLIASIEFNTPLDLQKSNITYFLITGDNDVVIKYNQESLEKFRFNPNYNNKLMAVLPGDRIASFSSKEFNAININNMSEDQATPFTFKLKLEGKPIKKVEEIDEVIAAL